MNNEIISEQKKYLVLIKGVGSDTAIQERVTAAAYKLEQVEAGQFVATFYKFHSKIEVESETDEDPTDLEPKLYRHNYCDVVCRAAGSAVFVCLSE